MLQWTRPFSRRAILASAFAAVTITAAGAATYHRLAVTQSAGGGSEGATEFLQSGTGGAVQGEVASSAYTGFPYQFGLFGFYHGAANQLGIGALGISSNGYGVAGAGEGGLPAVLAQAEGNGYGLEAITTSTSNTAPAIFAAPKGGAAADGIDALISGGTRNYAVSGTDTAGTGSGNAGIYGSTTGDLAGVIGVASGNSDGVVAASGVTVNGGSPPPSAAQSPAPIQEQAGLFAMAENGPGIYSTSAQDPAIAAEMRCNAYNGTDNCSGLLVQQDGNKGYPLLVYEPGASLPCSNAVYPFSVDSAGDIVNCGTTVSSDAYQRNSNPASDAVTYSAKQTESTVEDFGSAQLVNGSASVALAADFKQTINANSAYMVFLTPYGESHGLYVSSRTASGFSVRENDGGRSSMAFDYRIVARPYGERLARLPHESQVVAHRPTDRPWERKSYAQLVAAADARNRAMFGGPHRNVSPPIPVDFASALKRR